MFKSCLPILTLSLLLLACGDDDSESNQASSNSESTAATPESEEGSTEEEGAAPEGATDETPAVPAEGAEAPPGEHAEGHGGEVVHGEAPMPEGPEGNLFTRGEIRLGVSSVDNAAEHGPALLVDGDNNTYWSSRAGDAVGSWLAFRVPDSVGITKIRLVAGRRAANGSWAPGPRIRKVEVFHNGTSKGEFTITGARPDFHDIEVTGVGGLWQVVVKELTGSAENASVSVAEMQVIGRRGADSFDPYESLAQRCRVGAVDAVFGQAVVGAEGLRARGTRNLAGDHSYAVSDSAAPEIDQQLRDLAQGSHTKPVTPLRAIDFQGEGGNRVLFLLYGVDPNSTSQRQARQQATQPLDGGGHCYRGGEEFIGCYELYLARFSLPADGIPSHDGSLQFGADTCQIRELETEVRDFDSDDRAELLVRLTWNGTAYCPSGPPTFVDEAFVQLESGLPQFQVQISSTHPDGARSGHPIVRGERSFRDVNSDGKPDVVFAAETEQCVYREGTNEPECSESETTTNYTYRSEVDIWMDEDEELQIESPEPPPGDAPPGDAPPSAAGDHAHAAPAAPTGMAAGMAEAPAAPSMAP